jgi:hypothetical protein
MHKAIQSFAFTAIDSPTPITPPEAPFTSATAINDCGEVAGAYFDSSGEHGFIYDDGAFTTLDAPNALETAPDAINSRGEVAGFYVENSRDFGFCV